MSKPEEKIAGILKEHGVSFEREVIAPGLTGFNGAPLRYDFAIFDKQGKICYYIEIDSEIHFMQIKYFCKTKQEFLHRQEMDRRKNKYAIIHKIPLIRIPFWEFEGITYNKIFNNKEFLVNNIYHNDIIWRERRGK